MEKIHENFAAIAVMGELYDSGKDIYDVLAAYLKIVIHSDNLRNFTSTDITNRINKTNSFRISESIVKTSLKRLGLKRDSGYYVVDDKTFETIVTAGLEAQTNQNQIVLDKLFYFISDEKKCVLTDKEKTVIENQFFSYLSDPEYDGNYTILISKFLMENSMDREFYDAINRIKEGLLVYEGICFSPELGSTGKWDIPLDIYFELEVLFYFVGFNGEIHKEIYGQLIEYIDEINKSAPSGKDKTIRLFYTSDVKAEIEGYFTTAENIYEKNEVVDPSKSAMIHILNGVNSKRDIQMKKVNFYNSLLRMGITERDFDFYSEENLKYNIITGDVLQYNCAHIDSDRDDEYIHRCSEKINQINILRKDKNGSLKEARSILLTANSTILKCAYMPFAIKEGEAPKAVNLDYLITRFWYKLSKGFGKGESPKSIDIISRAQMIISSMTTCKVSKAYEDIKRKYVAGEITDNDVAGILYELRKVQINPEDITPESISDQVSFLTDYDLNAKLEELKKDQLAREQDKETIKALESRISELEVNNSEEIKKRDKRIAELVDLNREALKLNKEINDTSAKVNDLNRELVFTYYEGKTRTIKVFRAILFILCSIIIAFVIFLLCKLLLKIDDSISGVISIVITLLSIFITPIKKLWKKFIKDYKFKPKSNKTQK